MAAAVLMRYALALIVILLLGFLSSMWLSRPVVDGTLDQGAFAAMTLAPTDKAVTLAMSREGNLLLVTGVSTEGITAIDIAAVTGDRFEDGVDAYARLGANGLRALYGSGDPETFAWDALGLPLKPRYPNIAAGTNYAAHAREVGLDEEPFLFPKLSHPTPWDDPVLPGARLDYEVELCAVLLAKHSAAEAGALGYTLCGDYTDRWVLVRELDLDGIMGRSGFPPAKGGKSRLPVGPLLLIPLFEDFYQQIELSLYVNSTLRQRDMAANMVWPPRAILEKSLADCERHYLAGKENTSLTNCESIPAGTLVLTGTPEGVLFKLGTLWNPWAYLGEGDVVTSFGTYLGLLRNEVLAD